MLVLQCDSGYNSPCDGIAPSSLCSSSEKFSKPDIETEVRRKLRFEQYTRNSGSYITTSKSSNRSREIARKLIEICDSFEKQITDTNDIVKDLTWTASIFRLIRICLVMQ